MLESFSSTSEHVSPLRSFTHLLFWLLGPYLEIGPTITWRGTRCTWYERKEELKGSAPTGRSQVSLPGRKLCGCSIRVVKTFKSAGVILRPEYPPIDCVPPEGQTKHYSGMYWWEGHLASLRCLLEILLYRHELRAGEVNTELGSLISMKMMAWPGGQEVVFNHQKAGSYNYHKDPQGQRGSQEGLTHRKLKLWIEHGSFLAAWHAGS